MKDVRYTYTVARIRAVETELLNTQDIERLITASDYEQAVRLLRERGFIGENNADLQKALDAHIDNARQLLCESSSDARLLDFLIAKNDFHNLKAALKGLVSHDHRADVFITPAITDPDAVASAVYDKKFDELPEFLREPAEKAYEVLSRTMDGQLSDVMLDAMALDDMRVRAEETDNKCIVKLTEFIIATTAIKIALRASKTGKDEMFLQMSLSETTPNRNALIQAALKGFEELLSFLEATGYKEAADCIRLSSTAFEKWCDDNIMSQVESAKYKINGPEPLIAYFIAKEAEIKTMRIVLAGKHNNLPAEMIRERVRKLYV